MAVRLRLPGSRGKGFERPSALQKFQRVADAQRLTGFRRSHARVRGHSVEMVEALGGRPCGKRGPAVFREPLLKRRPVGSGLRIARRHGTPRARIAALEMYFADAK